MAEQDNNLQQGGNLIDAARQALEGGAMGNIIGKAQEMLQNGASDLLGDPEALKKKVTDIGKAITPDSLDDKVEQVVGAAVDLLTEKFGGKKADDTPAE